MDDVSKYRLTGAFIWLLLLVIVVPGWYSHPVNFQPSGHQEVIVKGERPLVEHIYELPVQTTEKQAEIQSNPLANDQLNQQLNIAAAQNDKNKDASLASVEVPHEIISENKVVTKSPVKVKKSNQKQWIVKVTAYKDIKKANNLLGRLESNYEVRIKEFKSSGTYSVRTGPYSSRAKAEQAKKKLDKMLRTNAQIVQFN